MAQQYPHLPGINVELLDGSLRTSRKVEGPVTMIVSTAKSGPSNLQYLMSDPNVASAIFGDNSPLMKRATEARIGGAKNIVLYRIGGQAAEIHDLWGPGSLLRSKEESAQVGVKYRVYMGPSPRNAAQEILMIFEGDRVVYSNATGGEVDLGKFEVVGFAPTGYRVGTLANPVLLKNVVANISTGQSLAASGNGVLERFELNGTGVAVIAATVGGVAAPYVVSQGTGANGRDEIVFTGVAQTLNGTATGTPTVDLAGDNTNVTNVTLAGQTLTRVTAAPGLNEYRVNRGAGAAGVDQVEFGRKAKVLNAVGNGSVSTYALVGTSPQVTGVTVGGQAVTAGNGEGQYQLTGNNLSFNALTVLQNLVGDGSTTTFNLPFANLSVAEVTVAGSAVTEGAGASEFTHSVGTGPAGVDQIIFGTAPANAAAIVVEALRNVPFAGQSVVINYTVRAGESSDAYTINYTAGQAPANGAAVSVQYHVPATGHGASFIDGADNINCSWKKLYELFDSALDSIESTIATELVVDQVILDAPNIADMTDLSGLAADANVLEYVRKELDENGDTVYYWSRNKVVYALGNDTTIDPVAADKDANGQPIVVHNYSEVNFAHRLAFWCHNMTEEERFVNGVIGTSGPANTTRNGLSRWIGKLPEKDISGRIIGNGTGLLGNRFMAGTINQKKGFFATDSGYPDGNPLFDSNGVIVDAGKFLTVVAQQVVPGNSSEVVNAASLYAGLIAKVTVGNSTTNMLVPNVALPYVTKKSILNDFTGCGYVTFQEKDRGVTVVSGELATADGSDYDYISTSLIVAELVRSIRNTLDPFIGKGLNQFTLSAAQTAIETQVFEPLVKIGAIQKFDFQVIPPQSVEQRGKLLVPVTIVPAFELREVNVPVKLAYEI